MPESGFIFFLISRILPLKFLNLLEFSRANLFQRFHRNETEQTFFFYQDAPYEHDYPFDELF